MKKFIVSILMLLTAVSFAAENPAAFSGHGQAVLIPSTAEIWLTISYKGPEVGELFGRIEAESARIHGILKKIGIPQNDIKDQGNKITDFYDNGYDPNIWARYMLSRKLLVTVRDLNLLGKALAKAKEEEIEQIDGPIFDYPDRGKAEDTAIQAAVGDARKKAEAFYKGSKTPGEPKILSKNISTSPDPSGTPGQLLLSADITASFN